MKTGINDIQNLMQNQLYAGGGSIVKFSGGQKKYFKDTAKKIMELLEKNGDAMNGEIKTLARGRGIAEDVLAMCEKVEKAFGFDAMPLTDTAIDVYKWLIEREQSGQTIAAFVLWAKDNEGGKFIRMYRKDPANIRIDWERAFSKASGGGYDEVRF